MQSLSLACFSLVSLQDKNGDIFYKSLECCGFLPNSVKTRDVGNSITLLGEGLFGGTACS